jgi:hypothetical protein
MEMSDELYSSAALAPRKEPPVSTEQEAGWDPETVWRL